MRSRAARIGVIIAGLLGLLSTTTPAHATTVATVEFVVTVVVGAAGQNNSIAYPCFGGLPDASGVPTTELALCTLLGTPPVEVKQDKKGVPTVNWNINHNHNTPVALGANIACIAGGVNVNKPNKSAVEAGNCVITGTGTVAGHCGMSTGTFAGAVVGGGIGNVQGYAYSLKFTGIATLLILTGNVTKNGRTGNLTGLAFAPPPATGSCTTKHQLTFVIPGAVAILIPTNI